jgi:hypothetical protein
VALLNFTENDAALDSGRLMSVWGPHGIQLVKDGPSDSGAHQHFVVPFSVDL